uniref:Uncharacterized protein n=1 Tax=Anguilla anguilla TaxID=7936 RepID=A0A0E9PKN0_ANGAN
MLNRNYTGHNNNNNKFKTAISFFSPLEISKIFGSKQNHGCVFWRS